MILEEIFSITLLECKLLRILYKAVCRDRLTLDLPYDPVTTHLRTYQRKSSQYMKDISAVPVYASSIHNGKHMKSI